MERTKAATAGAVAEEGGSGDTTAPDQPPTPRWVYLRSALTDAKGTAYVGTVTNRAAGAEIRLMPLDRGEAPADAQLWQITKDGRILSRSGNGWVLDVGGSGGTNRPLVLNPEPALTPPPMTQRWQLVPAAGLPYVQTIRNMGANGNIVVADGTSGPVDPASHPLLRVVSGTVTSSPSYRWYVMPVRPLVHVMAMPPVPFPTFEGAQRKAYDAIRQRLGIGSVSLRSLYGNAAAPIAAFGSLIAAMRRPAGTVDDVWSEVVEQLTSEFTAVCAVRALFRAYFEYHTAVFASQSARLEELFVAARVDKGADTSGVATAVLEGIARTALGAIPEGGGILAGLMTTTLDGIAADKKIRPRSYQTTAAALWTDLSATFEAMLAKTQQMEQTICADWGKLQAVQSLIVAEGPVSLAWPVDTFATLLDTATFGYSREVLKILLPSKYQIYVTDGRNASNPRGDAPPEVQYVEQLADGRYLKYFLAERENRDAYPADVNVLKKYAFSARGQLFHGLDGWSFPVAFDDDYLYASRRMVVLTLTNDTPEMLTIATSDSAGDPHIVSPPLQALRPYASIQVVVRRNTGIHASYSFVVTIVGSTNPQISVTLRVDYTFWALKGAAPSVAYVQVAGCTLSPPRATATPGGYSATLQCTIQP